MMERYTGVRNWTESLGQVEARTVGNQKVVHYKQQQSVSYLSLREVSWNKGGSEGAIIIRCSLRLTKSLHDRIFGSREDCQFSWVH